VCWRATGTFDGSARFEGLAPNGAELDLTGCDVIAVRDGKLYRNDVYMNAAEMMRQLGALPPAGSAAENALIATLNAKHSNLWLDRGAGVAALARPVSRVRGCQR